MFKERPGPPNLTGLRHSFEAREHMGDATARKWQQGEYSSRKGRKLDAEARAKVSKGVRESMQAAGPNGFSSEIEEWKSVWNYIKSKGLDKTPTPNGIKITKEDAEILDKVFAGEKIRHRGIVIDKLTMLAANLPDFNFPQD